MATIEKLVKSLDALKLGCVTFENSSEKADESSNSPFHRSSSRNGSVVLTTRDKVYHCNAIADLICNPSLATGQDFNRLLGLAVEILLFYCDDEESDVRIKANESLNRLIKCLIDTHSSRILVELFKEMRRHSRQGSLKAAIIRFGESCHSIRPSKRRTYWSNLHSCLIELAKCTEQESLQETLTKSMDKIMSVFGRFSSDQELLVLVNSFLPNLNHPSSSIKRHTSSSLVICVECSRHPKYLASFLMDSIVCSLKSEEDAFLGYILLLKQMVTLFYLFNESANDQEKIYTAFLKLYALLETTCEPSTVLSLLEALQQMLRSPSNFLVEYLTRCESGQALPVEQLTKLICSRFLLSDSNNESSRVSIKSLALSVIASCVSIHPASFLLELDCGNKVWDLLKYSQHSDPQIKCQVTSLVSYFVKAVLIKYESYNEFLLTCCSAESISKVPFLEDLLVKFLHLNGTLHPVLIKTILTSLQETVNLLANQNECIPFVITVLSQALELASHQYWLVRLELLNLFACIPFIKIVHHTKSNFLQSRYLTKVLIELLCDEDHRVRLAASDAIVTALPNIFSPGSLIRSDPVLTLAWQESQNLSPTFFTSSKWDKNDNFIMPFKMCPEFDPSISENLEFIVSQIWEHLICHLDSRNALSGLFSSLNCLIEAYPATIYTKSWQTCLSTQCPRMLFSLLVTQSDLSIRQILHSLLSHWLCGYIHITNVDGVSLTINDLMIDHMKLLCDDLHLVSSVVTASYPSTSKKVHASVLSPTSKLGQALTSSYSSYLVSTEFGPHKFCKFISSVLMSLSRLLEMIPIESKIDSLLSNIQTICHLAPVSALVTVRQLLKSCFNMNFVQLIYLKDSTRLPPPSCPCSLYESCVNQPIDKLRNMQHHTTLDSYWEREKRVKRRSERKILALLEKASNDVTIASNIKLFEPIVVKALHTYTVTGSSELQVAILQLVCQLVKVRVNYSLLDADQIFLNFIQSQFENDNCLRDPLLVREIFQLLTLLSHEKLGPTHVVTISQCIQWLQSVLVIDGALVVPAMESLLKDLFLFRSSESQSEIEAQRETVISIFLKVPLTLASVELLLVACYCVKSELKSEASDTWKRISSLIVDGLLQNITGNNSQDDQKSQHLMYRLYRLWASLHPTSLPSVSSILSKQPNSSVHILSLALVLYSRNDQQSLYSHTDQQSLLRWLLDQIYTQHDQLASFILLHLINSTTFQLFRASNTLKAPTRSILSMRPLLALEWCHVMLLSESKFTTEIASKWDDILNADSSLLHAEMVKRGLILLLCEFASDNAELLTWLVVNHVRSVVRWCDEAPVKELINSIYKNPSSSELFIASLSLFLSKQTTKPSGRESDSKDASFITKLLECLEYVHPKGSGCLVALLVEQIVVGKGCRSYLSLRRRAEKLAIERLHMIMKTTDEKELRSHFLLEDVKHLLHLLEQVPGSPVAVMLNELLTKLTQSSALEKEGDDEPLKNSTLFPANRFQCQSLTWPGAEGAKLGLNYVACKHVTHAHPCPAEETKEMKVKMKLFVTNLPCIEDFTELQLDEPLINALLTFAPFYRKFVKLTLNSTESLTQDTLTLLVLFARGLMVPFLAEWSLAILSEVLTSQVNLSLLEDPCNVAYLEATINCLYGYFMNNELNQTAKPVAKLALLLDSLDHLTEPTRSTLSALCIPLARLKYSNSYLLVPPAVWSAGWKPKIDAQSCYPIVPSEYLRDSRALGQFIQRVTKLACTSKVQFEEIWMAFLGIISLLQLEEASDDAEVAYVASLAIKSLTKLLQLCTSVKSIPSTPSSCDSSYATDSPEIDIQSSLRFLLDLFAQICTFKPCPPVLASIHRSYTRIFNLFFEKSQFETSLCNILNQYKQAALDEDEMQLQYLELGILRCSSVIRGLYFDRVQKCIENGLRSPVPSTRSNTLRGIALLVEGTEGLNESIITLTSEYILNQIASSEEPESTNSLIWKVAFAICESKSDFASKLLAHVTRMAGEADLLPTQKCLLLQSCRRLIESRCVTDKQVDPLVRVAIDRLHSVHLVDESTTFELLVIAINTFDLSIGGDGEDALSGMEKIAILFDRLKFCTESEANVICDMLPQLLVKLFPIQDVLNKVIGEFLSGQQVWLHLLAELMYRVFGQLSRNSNANTQIVNEWVCLSLASFGQLKPFTLAIWSLACFLLAASTNGNLKLLFPCMRDTFGRSQQHLHSIILTIVYSVFREELQRQEDKMILDSTIRTILGNGYNIQ